MTDSNPPSDRNLLFGILALQAGTISETQLLNAMKQWTFEKTKPLGQILVDQSALSQEQLDLIEPMVDAQLKLHGNDPAKALHSISSIPSVALSIREIADDDVQSSLTHFRTVSFDSSSSQQLAATAQHRPARVADQRFRIIRSHAKGGLGEVYVAQDTELNREVALKEIQDRFADVDQSRNRFVLEAEITGGLEHPGIVPVYGLGSYDDGRPYYAMRFIKGDSLKEAIRVFHKSDLASSERSLELRKLLGRFVDVCQAIGYAHSRGVLHRDLKPGNIMLGKYGETLVVDWGLAKVMGRDEESRAATNEETMHPSSGSNITPTLMGSAIGTPAFMPPEQAAGLTDQLGPHSDIYSLGATLYYLLTGKPPFSGRNSMSVLEQVRSGDFSPPRSVDSSIPVELNAICLKAMATAAEDRYASTIALADDIERFLADEAVTAVPDPLSVKVRRWVRKHPTFSATSAAAILISTLALVVFSTVVSGKNAELAEVNSTLDKKNTELQTSIANEQAAKLLAQQNEKIAEENYELARQSVDKYFTSVSENQLLNEPFMDGLRKDLLTSASEFYLSFVERRKDDPTALMDLGNAQVNLGNVSWHLGDTEKAIATLEAATKSFDLAASHASSSLNVKLNQLWNDLELAGYYQNVARADDSIKLFNQALRSVEELRRAEPESSQVVNLKAHLHKSRGEYFYRNDQWDRAIEDLLEVVKLLEGFEIPRHEVSRDDIEFDNNDSLAQAYTKLGIISFREQRNEDCETWYKKAVSLNRKIARESEESNQSISALSGLASSISMMSQYYRRQGELDRAHEMANEAVTISKKLSDEHPELATLQSAYLVCMNNLAIVHQVNDEFDKANAINDEAAEVLRGLIRKHPDMLVYRNQLGAAESNRGNTCLRRGNFQEAIQWYDRSNETMGQLLERSPDDARAKIVVRNSHWGRADAYVALEDYEKAIDAFDQTLKFARESSQAEIRMARAKAIAESGDYKRAIEAVETEMAREDVQDMIRFDGASVLMSALAKLAADSEVDAEDRQTEIDSIKNRATELLRNSFDGGFLKPNDDNSPLGSEAFRPLRDVPEFQQLLEDAGQTL